MRKGMLQSNIGKCPPLPQRENIFSEFFLKRQSVETGVKTL